MYDRKKNRSAQNVTDVSFFVVYGGCFEEDIRRFMCDRVYRITGFGCTGEVCTNSQGEKGQCTVPKRLAMAER